MDNAFDPARAVDRNEESCERSSTSSASSFSYTDCSLSAVREASAVNKNTADVHPVMISYNGMGQEEIRNNNGTYAVSRSVDDAMLLQKLNEGKGRKTDFSYDAQGQPMLIQRADGTNLVKGTDNNWYLNRPGSGEDVYMPIKVERDKEGRVVVKSAKEVTIYDTKGEHHLSRAAYDKQQSRRR